MDVDPARRVSGLLQAPAGARACYVLAHGAGRPSDERGKHLFEVQIPMLFLQGTSDELADLLLLQPLVERLGARATLKLFPDADHSFHVPARTGRKDADVRAGMLDGLASWCHKVVQR